MEKVKSVGLIAPWILGEACGADAKRLKWRQKGIDI